MHLLTPFRRGGSRGRLVRRGPVAALLTLGLLAPVGLASAAADVPTGEPMPAAAGWVARQLAADPSPSATELADAILAFAATGSARDAGDDALDQLTALGDAATDSAGDAAKSLLAAAAQGADQATLDGFKDALLAHKGTDGGFPDGGPTQLFVQSLAILALEATADGESTDAVDYLADRVCPDGSVNVPGDCDAPGDVDTTAVAAQALQAADRPTTAMVDFLLDAQNDDGSFGATGDANTNSTALAAQALRSAGEEGAADEALAWVLDRQKGCEAPEADRGSFATYTDADGDVAIATTQAVFAASPALHQLDASTSAAETAHLNCSDDFCPAGGGVSVVVDFTALVPDSEPVVACAPRLAEGATGLEVLAAAGFDATTFDFGTFGEAVCAIDDLPELEEGECFHASGGFWSYWSADRGGSWEEYPVGPGDSTPAVGSIEGWAWAPSFPGSAPRVSTTPASESLPEPPYDRGIADACPGSYPRTFTDIAGSVHEEAIRCIADAGITKGTADPSLYDPRAGVTRAQLASFLARSWQEATGAPLPAGGDRFTDVGGVHEGSINALAAADVINGVGDGTRYAPNETVNRAQMAALLARFLDLLDDEAVDGSFPPATDRDVFTDDDGSVHETAIDRLAVQGVVQGRRDGSYGPLHPVTRDQLATFLARALDLAVDSGLAAPVG